MKLIKSMTYNIMQVSNIPNMIIIQSQFRAIMNVGFLRSIFQYIIFPTPENISHSHQNLALPYMFIT